MRTITFFSYKGGTGRSLAVANAACYLSQLGFTVAVLDFDLEAPGLGYKFSAAEDGSPVEVTQGLVDYLFDIVIKGERPGSLSQYTTRIHVAGEEKPPVTLLPAGRVPSASYWQKLSRLNWHELFYSPNPKGVKLFLDLRSRIAEEFGPDFLLIDSRTGITEMGGVATAVLADAVVCILLNNRENLDGARAVLRALNRTRREMDGQPASIVVALSRLPKLRDHEREEEVLDRMRRFLSEEAEDLSDTLTVPEVFVLHSEPALLLRESLRVGTGVSSDESVLLRDYLRLFAQLVPTDMIQPRLVNLFASAKEKIWTDPDDATREVEELAEFYGRPEGFREVLRFYVIRKVEDAKALRTAQRYWELTRDAQEPLLRQVVKESFSTIYRYGRGWQPDLEFVESVWRACDGEPDPELGRMIGDSYANLLNPTRAAAVYLILIESGADAREETVAMCIDLTRISGDLPRARALIERFKGTLGSQDGFLSAWADFAVSAGDAAYFVALSEEPVLEQLIRSNPSAAIKIAQSSGKTPVIDRSLWELLDQAIRGGPSSELRGVGAMYAEMGRSREFEQEVRTRLSARDAERFLQEMDIRGRGR